MIDNTTPVRKDTAGGAGIPGADRRGGDLADRRPVDGPPVPLDKDGIPVLTADPDALLDTQEKIRVALRNVDRVITDNEEAVKDTLLQFRDLYRDRSPATASGITRHRRRRRIGRHRGIDNGFGKTQDFLDKPRQRQIWRRIAADRDLAARTGREFRQEAPTRSLNDGRGRCSNDLSQSDPTEPAAPRRPALARSAPDHRKTNPQKRLTDVLDKTAASPRPRRPLTRPQSAVPRALRRYLCLDDFEATARRRLPKFLYGYISGGAETDAAVRDNRRALRRIRLRAARAQRRLRPRPDHDAVRQDLRLAVRHSADGLVGAVRLSRRHRSTRARRPR